MPMGTADAPLGTIWVNDLENTFKAYHKQMALKELDHFFFFFTTVRRSNTIQFCIIWIKRIDEGWYAKLNFRSDC